MNLKSVALAIFALAALAGAAPAKIPIEVSSPGGTFSVGVAQSLTTFTIFPFDVMVDWFPSDTLIPVVGSVRLPSLPTNPGGISAGQLSMVVEGVELSQEMFAGVFSTGDPETQIRLGDDRHKRRI